MRKLKLHSTSVCLLGSFSSFDLCRDALGMRARAELYDSSIWCSVHRTVKSRFGKVFIALSFFHCFLITTFFYCGSMQLFSIFKENNFHLFRYLLDGTLYYASLFVRTVSFLTWNIALNRQGSLAILYVFLLVLWSIQ